MSATVTLTTYNYQPTCPCGWTGLATPSKLRAQDAANGHNTLWHDTEKETAA